MRRPLRAIFACAFVALAWCCAPPGTARADQQRDPELKALLQKIIGSSDCFADKFESEVWYKTMEPRLARLVPTHDARIEILELGKGSIAERVRKATDGIGADILIDCLGPGSPAATMITYRLGNTLG